MEELKGWKIYVPLVGTFYGHKLHDQFLAYRGGYLLGPNSSWKTTELIRGHLWFTRLR